MGAQGEQSILSRTSNVKNSMGRSLTDQLPLGWERFFEAKRWGLRWSVAVRRVRGDGVDRKNEKPFLKGRSLPTIKG